MTGKRYIYLYFIIISKVSNEFALDEIGTPFSP
jgi:hypothetical protein